MKKILFRLVASAAALLIPFAPAALAQTDNTAKLPSAIEVLRRFADVSGGAAKFREIKTLKMTGKLSVEAQNLSGTMDVMVEVPNKLLSKAIIPNQMTEFQGSDGQVAWSNNSMMGSRIVVDREKDAMLEDTDFQKYYEPGSYYSKMSVAGIKDIDGDKCYEVKLTKKNGLEATEYFSVESGLSKKTSSMYPHQMGELKIETRPGDYRETGGIKFPYRIEITQKGGVTIVLKFDSIEINPKLDALTFSLPAEIKALIPDEKKADK